MNRRWGLAAISCCLLAVGPTTALADKFRPNASGGYSIYDNHGRYKGVVLPNDTGGYDVRDLSGRTTDTIEGPSGYSDPDYEPSEGVPDKPVYTEDPDTGASFPTYNSAE